MAKAQMEIPGTERPKIAQIELAAEEFINFKDKHERIGEQLNEAKEKLIDVMHVHEEKLSVDADGNRCYKYDDLILTLKSNENIKVKEVKEREGDDD